MTRRTEMVRKALSGRFAIEGEIGSGGMGTVYLAKDVKHGRQVAVKVMRPELTTATTSKRFLEEVRIVASLSHPHIVPLHESGEAEGYLYYVMPFVEGETLRAVLDREGTVPLGRAISIVRDTSDALYFAHEKGVIHRDVKPGNILLAGKHTLVADFGIARAMEAATGTRLTGTEQVLGTLEYMSPEQALGDEEVDARSDQYSLASVLFEMLVGGSPFGKKTGISGLVARINTDPPIEELTHHDVPTAVVEVIRRSLARTPEERFPTVQDFAQTLEAAATDSSGTLPAPRRNVRSDFRLPQLTKRRALVAASLAAAGAAAFYPWPSRTTDALVPTDLSYVVVPFQTAASGESERQTSIELAEELTRQLNGWETVSAEPAVSTASVMSDLGLPPPPLSSITDGLDVARELGVPRMVTLLADVRGDSAFVEANVLDVATAQRTRSLQADSESTRLGDIAAGIAHRLLGLTGSVSEIESLRRQSSHPGALGAYQQALTDLAFWRLPQGETKLREALALDSTFAMASHTLATSLYWQAAREPNRLQALGPEIGQLTRAALRHGAGLSPSDSAHVRAFYQFQIGDYEAARRSYTALVSRDSTDAYAWLHLGSVEYRDRWLVEKPDGTLTPRNDWNLARRAFTRTVELSPNFDLGYGHLFDITRRLTDATRSDREGMGFHLPSSDLVAVWERAVPFSQQLFVPVYTDSLVWMSTEAFDQIDRATVRDRLRPLVQSTLLNARRWAAYSPNDVAPMEQLAAWSLEELAEISRRGRPFAPSVRDSLANDALRYASQALVLKEDTLPIDLARLGALQLITGDVAAAVELVDRWTELVGRSGRSGGEAFATNVLLATGQGSAALEIASRPTTRTRYAPDGNGGLVAYGGAEPIVAALIVAGAMGIHGPPVDDLFTALNRLWSEPRLTMEQISVLRRDAAPRIAPILLESGQLKAWSRDVDPSDPIWSVVEEISEDQELRTYIATASQYPSQVVSDRARAFLLGGAALRAGSGELALQLFSRLDSIPFQITTVDSGWGFLSRSLHLRAEAAELSSWDARDILAYHQRFSDTWIRPDSIVHPLLQETLRAMDTIREGS